MKRRDFIRGAASLIGAAAAGAIIPYHAMSRPKKAEEKIFDMGKNVVPCKVSVGSVSVGSEVSAGISLDTEVRWKNYTFLYDPASEIENPYYQLDYSVLDEPTPRGIRLAEEWAQRVTEEKGRPRSLAR